VIFLPDTNAVSAYLRGQDANLVARTQEEFSFLRLSVIVVAEREFGFIHGGSTPRQRPWFEELLNLLPIEPFTFADAVQYAQIRSFLEKRRHGIGPMETLIAAQALRLGATVVTHKAREFSRVPGLKCEDWQAG
jgi:tRNA(fMet)-specific endonuclease VapC